MPVKKESLGKQGLKTFLIIYIIAFYFCLHMSHVKTVFDNQAIADAQAKQTSFGGQVLVASEPEMMNIVTAITQGLSHGLEHPAEILPISANLLLFMLGAAFVDFLAVVFIMTEKERNQDLNIGKSAGSAEWNTKMDQYLKDFSKPYDPKKDPYDPNMILSKNLRLNMDNKKTNRNMNCLVIGGSGTGKSFKVIKPNMAQMNCSCVVTDPKGELLECMANALIEKGITVKVFSTSDMVHSNCYNPFDYVYNEDGTINEEKVSTMVYLYLKNANGAKEKSSGDPFWEKSAKAFITALVYYLLENDNLDKRDKNFTTVLILTQMGKVSEDSNSSESSLDIVMNQHKKYMESKGKKSKAMENYETFKLAPAKTANSILITCAVDMQLFSNDNVKNLTRTDYDNDRNNVHLEKIGDEQTYLFINIPAANGTFDFLVAMMYSQLFDSLYSRAEKLCPYKYMIDDKFGNPVVSMLDSEAEAKHVIECIRKGKIKAVKTIKGAKYYQIRDKKKVILEKSNKEALQKIIDAVDTFTVKKGSIRLPWHVRCLMDEFANIGEIPNFPKYLATMRSYEISCTIVLQSIAQLKGKYEKNYEEVVGNCDTIIFLGSTENETAKYISDMLGEKTQKTRNMSYSKKSGTSYTYSETKRMLMTQQEVASINEGKRDKCIVRIRDVKPFVDDKYLFLDHPNFNLTKDGLSKETMDTYFCSIPMSEVKKSSFKKAQSAATQIFGTTKVGKGDDLDEIKKDIVSKDAKGEPSKEDMELPAEKLVVEAKPSKEAHENQERTNNGEDTHKSPDEGVVIPSGNAIGSSDDPSDDCFYF